MRAFGRRALRLSSCSGLRARASRCRPCDRSRRRPPGAVDSSDCNACHADYMQRRFSSFRYSRRRYESRSRRRASASSRSAVCSTTISTGNAVSCAWSTRSNAAWITVTGGASGDRPTLALGRAWTASSAVLRVRGRRPAQAPGSLLGFSSAAARRRVRSTVDARPPSGKFINFINIDA